MAKLIDTFLGKFHPKTAAGKRFVQRHTVAKTKDVDGNDDDVFQATNIKQAKYPHSDPKLYEDVEPLDELSRKTLASYVSKASKDAVWKGQKAARHAASSDHFAGERWRTGDPDGLLSQNIQIQDRENRKNQIKYNRRLNGIDKAAGKLAENVEPLDELSRHTLMSYTRKAADDLADTARNGGTRPMTRDARKVGKRASSIAVAAQKLGGNALRVQPTKEEVEDLEELSKEAMGRYFKAAGADKKKIIATGGRSRLKDWERFNKRNQGQLRAVSLQYKKMKNEETEELDELSRATLTRYMAKSADAASVYPAIIRLGGDHRDVLAKEVGKRQKGIRLAAKRLAKEETEELDEISKQLAVNYANKADMQKPPKDASDPKATAKYNKRSEMADLALSKAYGKRVYDAKAKVRATGKVRNPLGEEIELDEKDLTQSDRDHMKASTFGLPKKRAYPMPDKAHARLAKAYATRYASPSQRAEIDRKADRILGEEDLNELSKETLVKYIHGAAKGGKNRSQGATRAAARLAYRDGHATGKRDMYIVQREEAEQIDELSAKTLGRYIDNARFNASSDAEHSGWVNGRISMDHTQVSGRERKEREIANKRHGKRVGGINLAVDKLVRKANEEVNQIDELSNSALVKYCNAANKDLLYRTNSGDFNDKQVRRAKMLTKARKTLHNRTK